MPRSILKGILNGIVASGSAPTNAAAGGTIILSSREVRIFLNGGFTNGGAYYGCEKYKAWNQQIAGSPQCPCSNCCNGAIEYNCLDYCNSGICNCPPS